MMLIACATAEIRYAHDNNGDEAPRGWIASSKYWSRTLRCGVLSVGTGRTRDEATEDLTSLIEENGVSDPQLFETHDSSKRAFLLRQAYRHARYHGVDLEYV